LNASISLREPTASPLSSRAALMMIASAGLFGFMAIAIRYASRQQHPFEIAFFRCFFGALAALPLIAQHGWPILRTDKIGFYIARCVIGMLGMMAGFWAIVHLPLAQAIALSYSSPLFVTIGAVLFLGEIVRLRRWSAVAAGFIGVLVIVRPGTDSMTAGAMIAVMAAALSGMTTVSIKFLSRSEPPDRIVLLTTLLWVPLSLPGALTVWKWPEVATWPWLVLSGILGTGGHYFWTRALRLADASLLAPFNYVQLLVVTLLAWCLFGESVDRYTATGAAIIIGATLYIARREATLARRHAVAAPASAAEPDL
jgi:drug/metabolite transporter (DMT)-like permease